MPPSRSITPEKRQDALRELNRGRSGLRFLFEWAKILVVSLLLFSVIRTFFVEAFKIPSGSMERTLQVGDFLLVNKLVYGAEVPFTHKRLPRLRDPRRGDVIVFEFPEDPTKNFVKRLVGVPGEVAPGDAADEAAWVVLIKPKSWERHGLKPWIEAARKPGRRSTWAWPRGGGTR